MSDIGLTYFGKSGYAHENRELALGNTQRVFAKLLEVAQTMAGRNVRVSQTPGYLARGLDVLVAEQAVERVG